MQFVQRQPTKQYDFFMHLVTHSGIGRTINILAIVFHQHRNKQKKKRKISSLCRCVRESVELRKITMTLAVIHLKIHSCIQNLTNTKIKQKKSNEQTHLNKTQFHWKQMKDQSKHKKCNSVLDLGVCVGVISETFHFLHCYFSRFFVFIFRHCQSKTSAGESHTQREKREATKRNTKS